MGENGKSILVVDDDVDNCSNLKDVLQDQGYDTDVAYDGPAALGLVKRRHYDVVLLDFKMPGMDGVSVYKEIKKLRPEIVAIMLTAYSGCDGARQALDAGTWKVLRKPVDLSNLLPLVEQASHQPIVLVVDDDKDFCENLWQLLRSEQLRVRFAYTEKDGLEMARESFYQLALVDLRLGNGDGCKVMDEVLASNPNAAKVLITGGHPERTGIVEEFLSKGVAICYKPVDIGRLLELIRASQLSN